MAPIAPTSSTCSRCAPTRGFNLGRSHRASAIFELHNVLNTHDSQSSFGTVTRGFANQAAFDAARTETTSYFGRVQEIVAPRVLKLAFRYNF